ncbi:MAG: hypothetical protein ACRD5B_16885 [Nitrososphaeraceae archaeon]
MRKQNLSSKKKYNTITAATTIQQWRTPLFLNELNSSVTRQGHTIRLRCLAKIGLTGNNNNKSIKQFCGIFV